MSLIRGRVLEARMSLGALSTGSEIDTRLRRNRSTLNALRLLLLRADQAHQERCDTQVPDHEPLRRSRAATSSR